MGRNATTGLGRLRGAAEAVKRVFTRGRGSSSPAEAESVAAPRSSQPRSASTAPPPRTTRRETDVPLDVLDRSYTPAATSWKASFRSDGSDRQKDQELTPLTATDRWNDEDHFTNKSGDPRIGTHRRTYEPDESRAERD